MLNRAKFKSNSPCLVGGLVLVHGVGWAFPSFAPVFNGGLKCLVASWVGALFMVSAAICCAMKLGKWGCVPHAAICGFIGARMGGG